MSYAIILPEMGEGVIEGTLTRWLVQQGDTIEAFDPLAEVETDKVTTEITSEVGGKVLELCVLEGTTVPVETVLAYIDANVEGIEPEPALTHNQEASDNGRSSRSEDGRRTEPYRGRVSPVVGRIAAEHEINLDLVAGTGLHGRITKRDILAYLEEQTGRGAGAIVESKSAVTSVRAEPSSASEHPADGGGDLLPLSTMRRAIAEHMVRSKQTSPHVTTVFEFDFAAVVEHRAAHKAQFKQEGARLTYTVYIVAAVVAALKAHPLANSTWTEAGILRKRAINIGLATAIEDGLIVPVIKGADGLNLLGLARTINDLAERARNKQLRPDEVQGGTFSITNHGTSGSLLATPIINQPQAGILGIGKIEKRVKVINDAIGIRPLAYASFTFDHRILDGATADAFMSDIKDRIENWR